MQCQLQFLPVVLLILEPEATGGRAEANAFWQRLDNSPGNMFLNCFAIH